MQVEMARSGGGRDVLKRALSAAILVSEAIFVGSKWPFTGFGLVRLGFGFGGLDGATVDFAVRGFFAGPLDLRGGAARFLDLDPVKSCSSCGCSATASWSSPVSSVSESSVSESSSPGWLAGFD